MTTRSSRHARRVAPNIYYNKSSCTYTVEVGRLKRHDSQRRTGIPTIQDARRIRDQLIAKREALQEIDKAKAPKPTHPKWDVEVTLRNGTKTVRSYTARHSAAAKTIASHREDVQFVGPATLAAS